MKHITRRQFANSLLFAGITVALGACSTTPQESTDAPQSEGSAALPSEPAPEEDALPEGGVVEKVFWTDDEIAGIVETLQSDMTTDGRLASIAESFGWPGFFHAYHTESTTLQITGPIPRYEYKDGVFEPESPYWGDDAQESQAIIFDGDEIIYLLMSTGSLAFFAADGIEYRAAEMNYNTRTGLTVTDAYEHSTTKKFALIDAADGLYVYDGVDVWHAGEDLQENPTLDHLNDDPLTTPGIEDLDLVSVLERQTFEYDSPEMSFEMWGNEVVTFDSVEDLEAYFKSRG